MESTMSDLSRTVEPTIVDPDSLASVDKLRSALRQANADLAAMANMLSHRSYLLSGMTQHMGILILAHFSGDKDAVSRELARIVENHVTITQVAKTDLH